MKQKEYGLYDKFIDCNREEELKHEFASFFGYRIDARDDIDLYTEEILYEFKFDINMKNVKSRAKAIAQALYYIRRLKYGRDIRVPSYRICVIDKKEAVLIETVALKDYYYSSKATSYDWDLQPSNPCVKLVRDLCECEAIRNMHIYELDKLESEKDFIREIYICQQGEQLSLFGDKKIINEYNFYEIFQYWESLFGSYVENGRKSSEYFIKDIDRGGSKLIEGNQVLFMMNGGDNVTKSLPLSEYTHFWNTYEKIDDKQKIICIRQKMDIMTEIKLRRFTGEFFTPISYVEKVIDYLERTVGKNWWKKGEYRLWDMAAGTGNLEYLLPAEAMKYCYISTLLQDDVDYCKIMYADATVFQYDFLNDDVNFLAHPELSAMGAIPKMPKKLVEDIGNPNIKWIFLYNPPYVTSNNLTRKNRTANKESVSMTEIQKLMNEKKMAEASRELATQFLFRLNMQFRGRNAYLAVISKIKYINSNNDQKIRDEFFDFYFKNGFLFCSKEFEGCKPRFPVGFLIWDMSRFKKLEEQNIVVDVYKKAEKIGIKRIDSRNKKYFLSKWIKRERNIGGVFPPFSSALNIAYGKKDTRDKIAEGFLFSLMSKGNDFANQNYNALFSGPYVSAGGMSVTENNFEKAMIVHAVRRIPKASWLNDRDQFMQPKEDVIKDNEFVTQCVIWGLFSDSNNTVSISNVKYKNVNYRVRNQLFPFCIERMRKWKIKNNDILNQLWGKHSDRFVAKWLVNRKITGDAMNVLESGEKIYKYFYAHLDEIAWPKYEIKNWDVGWWQVKMSLTDTGIGLELLSDLKGKMNQLEKCILDKIYQYEFLLPAIQEVNKES